MFVSFGHQGNVAGSSVAPRSFVSRSSALRWDDDGAPVDVEVRLHRRRQMVVVRAGDSHQEIDLGASSGRRRLPTLPGLDRRERLDTLHDTDDVTAPPESRTRPRVLIDDVDDDLARRYRAEAERILREGLLVDVG